MSVTYLVTKFVFNSTKCRDIKRRIIKSVMLGLGVFSFSLIEKSNLVVQTASGWQTEIIITLFLASFIILLLKTTILSKHKNLTLNVFSLLSPLLLLIFYNTINILLNGNAVIIVITQLPAVIYSVCEFKDLLTKKVRFNYQAFYQFFITIFFIGLLCLLVIPLSVQFQTLSLLQTLPLVLANNKIVLLLLLVITIIVLSVLRNNVLSRKHFLSIANTLLYFSVLYYFLQTNYKDYLAGSFSLISIVFLPLVYYLSSRIVNETRVSRTDGYIIIFGSLISLVLLKPQGIGLDMICLTSIMLLGGVSLLLASKKFFEFSLSQILISGLVVTVYFIIAIPLNLFSQLSTSPLDLLYIFQHNNLYLYYGGKANYPLVEIKNIIFILKNLVNDSYAKQITINELVYKFYYNYTFVMYFLVLSFHFMTSVVISKLIVLLHSQERFIKELIINKRHKLLFSNDIKLNVPNKPAIEITHLVKQYEKDSPIVLKDLSLSWQGNKIIGLLGNNGAGKSTLIKILSQKISLSSGSVSICGLELEKYPSECKKLISYLSDLPGIENTFTGREYLYFTVRLNDLTQEELANKVQELAEMLDIKYALDRPISSYSFGMKQKVALMAVLLLDTKIIILDEPFTGLDPVTTSTLHRVLRDYVNRGHMVIFSSHIIEIVNGLCDEIYFLYDGQIIDNNKLSSYRQTDQLLEEHCMRLIDRVTSK